MSIFIHHGTATLEIGQTSSTANITSPSQINDILQKWMASTPLGACIHSADKERTLTEIARSFRWIEAAGGIIKDPLDQFLLIHRRGHWDFPKGKIDEGEAPLTAAVREIEEEVGLKDLNPLHPLSPTFHIYRMHNQWYMKKTHWFLFSGKSDQPLHLQTEEDIDSARWMNASLIRSVWKEIYPSLQPLLEEVIG